MKTIQIQLSFTLDETAAKSFAELLVPAIKQAIGSSASEVEKNAELLALAIKKANANSASEAEEQQITRLRTSQYAIFGGQQSLSDQGLLVDNKEAMKLLKVSKRTLWQMHTTGKMPPPIRIGRAIRWKLDVLKKWVDAGCPVDPKWRTKGR